MNLAETNKLPKKRVMIIDDDVVFTDELKDILISSGYETIVENDPLRAFEVIRRVNPQVILLDINMPSKTGFDVANELRYGERYIRIPIIAITGYYKPAFDKIFEMYGIDTCLQKPFRPLDMISVIESV
jgi:two-component system response regulator MtrA